MRHACVVDQDVEPAELASYSRRGGSDGGLVGDVERKFHLCRAFRDQVGLPPHAYLTRLRIVRAKELLETGIKAGEVARRVGLYDQSQLNRHFRHIVGTTPGAYARAVRGP